MFSVQLQMIQTVLEVYIKKITYLPFFLRSYITNYTEKIVYN